MTHPSDINAALTEERLQVLARTIAQVRAEALQGHEPEKGDNAWTFGCRAYSRTCFAFDRLELTGEYPWLRTHTDGLAFTLIVAGEPIKFFRGDSTNPTSRSVQGGLHEAIRQGRLQFGEEGRTFGEGWFWLLAIETHPDGTVMNVVVLQANQHGETRNVYVVPLEATPIPAAARVLTTQREGVDLPPPEVGPKENIRTKVSGEDGSASS